MIWLLLAAAAVGLWLLLEIHHAIHRVANAILAAANTVANRLEAMSGELYDIGEAIRKIARNTEESKLSDL